MTHRNPMHQGRGPTGECLGDSWWPLPSRFRPETSDLYSRNSCQCDLGSKKYSTRIWSPEKWKNFEIRSKTSISVKGLHIPNVFIYLCIPMIPNERWYHLISPPCRKAEPLKVIQATRLWLPPNLGVGPVYQSTCRHNGMNVLHSFAGPGP